jgi:hypothetical protein
LESDLPQPYEKTSAPTGDIPKPELNPMTNPVLGRHLGRWAEVYFTTPVEQREQAVIELLQQLEREDENGAPETSSRLETREIPASVEESLSSIDELDNPTDRLAALEEAIRQYDRPQNRVERTDSTLQGRRDFGPPQAQLPGTCPVCQHFNQPDQWYCGMCGFKLRADDESSTRVLSFPHSTHAPEPPELSDESPDEPKNEVQPTNGFAFSLFGQPLETTDANSNLRLNRPSMWPLDTVEELPSSGVGAKLAILCAILLIAATAFFYRDRFRGVVQPLLESRQNSTTPPPQIAATQPMPAPPSGDSTRSETPTPNAGSQDHVPAPTQDANPATSEVNAPSSKSEKDAPYSDQNSINASGDKRSSPSPEKKSVSSSPTREPAATTAHNAQTTALSDSGNQELARAQALLSGGARSDASQASIWLWKAVGKNNGAAVLMLADLYARGNGVPQSCDQARILLSAAAKKGSAEATQKLREIQTQCAGR